MAEDTPDTLNNLVRLRDTIPEDLPSFFEDQRDPEANYMADFPAREYDTFMAHWTKLLTGNIGITQTILYRGEVAGNILSWVQDGEREVGYWISKRFWGKGITTQALRLLLEQIPERPMHAYVARHNIGSRRVLEKCGFRLIDDQPASTSDGDDGLRLILSASE